VECPHLTAPLNRLACDVGGEKQRLAAREFSAERKF